MGGVQDDFAINLDRIPDAVNPHGLDDSEKKLVLERVSRLRNMIEEAPKSIKWKMRAKMGERVRWYELPEADKEVVDSRITT